MIRYEKHKVSEIEWLDEIPEHWEEKRVKDLGDYQSGYFIDANEFDNDNEYPVFGGNGLRGYAGKYNHNGEYILIGRQGALCGNINFAVGKFWATEHAVVVYNRRNVHKRWYAYLLEVMNLNQYAISAAQPGLSVDKIKRLMLPFVEFKEQSSIARYLDAKISAINRKIELLTGKADKYKALRRSVINETVCRGLNHDVSLKDSGVEWIGMIPEHWSINRMKDIGFLYSGLSGKAGDDFNQDENKNNHDFIPFTNIFNNDTINPDVMGKVVVYEDEKQNKVKKGDLFFLMSSEDYDGLGKSSLLTIDLKDTHLNSFCKGFRITKKKVLPAFLNFQLQSDTCRKIMQIEGKGFTRMNLKSEKVTDFKVFVPKTTIEQQEIVNYLTDKTTQIDKILTNIGEQINKLTQLRKTLINDVVTGKIKVKEDL